MKIGISSAVFYPLDSEFAIEKVLNLGFTELEFFFNCDYEISQTFTEEIKRKLDAHGARLISLHAFTAFAEAVFFFSGYKRRQEEALKRYEEYFKAAKRLGVKYFTFHGDRAYKGLEDSSYILSDEDCDILKRLAALAKENGITLCLENVSWCKSASPAYLSEVSKRVPDVAFTLDLKQAKRAGVDVFEYISVMGTKIKNIHVSDSDDKHNCLLPGEGKFDFSSFFKTLKDINYNGDILIEVYSSDFESESQIIRARKYLEELISE